MKRLPCLMVLCILACSDKPDAEKLTCEDPDYSVCGMPLPALRPDRQRWPTFSEALAEEMRCSDVRGTPSVLLVGTCADGKHFIARDGGYVSGTRFFEGETLVGSSGHGDIGAGPCLCVFEYFTGTLASVRCEAPVFEPLCDTVAPAEWHSTFSQGTSSACECDDPR